MTIDEALDRLLEFAGSDLLLSCGSKARIRKDGNLELLEGEDSKVLQPSDTQRMMEFFIDKLVLNAPKPANPPASALTGPRAAE